MYTRALQDAVCALERAMRAMECHVTAGTTGTAGTAGTTGTTGTAGPEDRDADRDEDRDRDEDGDEDGDEAHRLPVSDSPQDLAMTWCEICLDAQERESDGVMYEAGQGPAV